MAISEDERKTLLGRFVVDPKFRPRLLDNPAAAASELKITLTPDEAKKIKARAETIKADAKRIDEALKKDSITFLPFVGLAGGQLEDKKDFPKDKGGGGKGPG